MDAKGLFKTNFVLGLSNFLKKGSKSPVVVAVKTLKSESKESKVKFLQEAAIMGQFNHRNVVMMHGVVLSGTPVSMHEFRYTVVPYI